jgi:pilus assembly protein CpaE
MSARRSRRWRGEDGQATVEFAAMLPYLLFAAILAWQVLLTTSAVNAAENAARAGSRAAGLGLDAEEHAIDALPGWLRPDARAERGPGPGCSDDNPPITSTRVVVCAPVPILFPGFDVGTFAFRRDAEFPAS